MSLMDIFRLNEIKAELARTIAERDFLKLALADTDKMEYSQLKQAIENLRLQKRKSKSGFTSGASRACEAQEKI